MRGVRISHYGAPQGIAPPLRPRLHTKICPCCPPIVETLEMYNWPVGDVRHILIRLHLQGCDHSVSVRTHVSVYRSAPPYKPRSPCPPAARMSREAHQCTDKDYHGKERCASLLRSARAGYFVGQLVWVAAPSIVLKYWVELPDRQ
jgi:hypothetical protein